MENTKYEMITEEGEILYHIKALRDINIDTHNGTMGGYIEKEDNLNTEGNAWVYDKARVSGNSRIFGNAQVCDNVVISNDAQVFGNTWVRGNAHIGIHGYIEHTTDYLCIGPIGSRDDFTTFYKTKDKAIYVCCGCFNDSIEAFEKAVREVHYNNKCKDQYLAAISFAKAKLL